ncbi:hypothetical protein LQ236_001368 [Nitrospina gracilis]|nr:hypothetical protein [Nitrospina sp. Nb-3]
MPTIYDYADPTALSMAALALTAFVGFLWNFTHHLQE